MTFRSCLFPPLKLTEAVLEVSFFVVNFGTAFTQLMAPQVLLSSSSDEGLAVSKLTFPSQSLIVSGIE